MRGLLRLATVMASLLALGMFAAVCPALANGKGWDDKWDDDKWDDDKWYKRGGDYSRIYPVPYGHLPPPEYRYGGGVTVVPVAVQPPYVYSSGYYPYDVDVYPVYQPPYGARSEAVSYTRTSSYSPYSVY